MDYSVDNLDGIRNIFWLIKKINVFKCLLQNRYHKGSFAPSRAVSSTLNTFRDKIK